MRAVIKIQNTLPCRCGSDIVAWILPVSRRSVSPVLGPKSPNWVSASSTEDNDLVKRFEQTAQFSEQHVGTAEPLRTNIP